MPETLDITFTLTPSDVRVFQWATIRRTMFTLPLWIVVGVLLVFLSNLYNEQIVVWLFEHGVPGYTAAVVVNWAPFFFFLCIIATISFVRRRRRKLQPTPPAYLAQQVVVSPDGIRVVRDGMIGDIAWKRVQKIRRRKGWTDVYLEERQAYIIPARAFRTAEDFEIFNQTVQRYFDAAHPANI